MHKGIHLVAFILSLLLQTLAPAHAEPLTFTDSRGNAIVFPKGSASFADAVVEFRVGKPEPIKEIQNPAAAMGAPDCTRKHTERSEFVCLGHGGSLTLKFVDNALVDVPGPDLYVFEIGPNVERTFVEISEDGVAWLAAGRAEGSLSSVDIAPYVKPGQAFRYVRLTDDPAQGDRRGRSPGADIDAVGAIGSASRVSLSSEVLFASDAFELRPDAFSAIDDALAGVAAGAVDVTVEGHTDSQASDDYNMELSQKRARAVADELVRKGIPAERITVTGYGESRPVASNDTEEGRRQNRRVELIFRAR